MESPGLRRKSDCGRRGGRAWEECGARLGSFPVWGESGEFGARIFMYVFYGSRARAGRGERTGLSRWGLGFRREECIQRKVSANNGADVDRPLWGRCELYYACGVEKWRLVLSTLLCREAFHANKGLHVRGGDLVI